MSSLALVGGEFKSGPGQWGDPRTQISVVRENVALLVRRSPRDALQVGGAW